jgi:hypothetical protein
MKQLKKFTKQQVKEIGYDYVLLVLGRQVA